MSRKAIKIILTKEQQAQLEKMTRSHSAERRLVERARIILACAYRQAKPIPYQTGQKPHGQEPKDQINLTDEESRIMPSHEGFVQGDNGQAVVDVDSMLIIAITLSQNTNDKQEVEPMLNTLGVARLSRQTGSAISR